MMMTMKMMKADTGEVSSVGDEDGGQGEIVRLTGVEDVVVKDKGRPKQIKTDVSEETISTTKEMKRGHEARIYLKNSHLKGGPFPQRNKEPSTSRKQSPAKN